MEELPPGVIPISAADYDRLYPIYEKAAQKRPSLTFQQWLKRRQRILTERENNDAA